ncbi:MAG: phosphoribosylformylglycinamidine synthase subunit PurS [Actinobacteria bacterium]|nr:phosphoribosylformylglycinamidine synthase subunit PurS [Actinomycetota bacterium]
MTRVVITVMPRAGVLDPQGQTVQRALGTLGFDDASDVRIGKRIELDIAGADAEARATAMCDALLANPLIESYTVAVLD